MYKTKAESDKNMSIDGLSLWDILFVCLYLTFLIAISIYVRRLYLLHNGLLELILFYLTQSSYGKKRNTVNSYFLAGRQMPWYLVSNFDFRKFISFIREVSIDELRLELHYLQAI